METKEKTTRGTTATLKKDNAIKIKVANSTITIGETYEISPKIDRTAPDGMQEKETTKFLNEGNKTPPAGVGCHSKNAQF